MAATLEKIYEVALHHYHMKLVAGRRTFNLVDWVHVVEEMDYVHFLKRTGTDRNYRYQGTGRCNC